MMIMIITIYMFRYADIITNIKFMLSTILLILFHCLMTLINLYMYIEFMSSGLIKLN